MKTLYRNRFQILIGERDFTVNAVFPIKWANLLDEQLDEASLTLEQTDVEIIKPLTNVTINIWNDKDSNDVRSLYFIVSNDSVEELPVGSGKYKHTLSLIEETKYLERFIVRSHGYVNSLGRIYYDENKPSYVLPTITNLDEYIITAPEPSMTAYTTPMLKDTFYSFPNFRDIFGTDGFQNGTADCIIYKDNIEIENYSGKTDPTGVVDASSFSFETALDSGIYSIIYSISESLGIFGRYEISVNYSFYVTSNLEPLPKWNARSVIERALTIAETITEDETPRFTLNEAQAQEFESIETPEFSFTQSTLREILQDVGKYVHGEPRLRNGVIYYDMYGENVENEVSVENYASQAFSQSVEQYATQLVSSVDNLVNSLDFVSGAITEPFLNGVKTLRTETLYARVEDGSAIIRTEYPIYAVTSLIWNYRWQEDGKEYEEEYELAPYVFESSEYERLSSFNSAYPTSRKYALYYTQGQPNIQGLWFKREKAWGQAYEDYSITSILKAVSGISDLNFSSVTSSTANGDRTYPTLAFRITYIPIYSALARQTKSYINDFDKPTSLAYNQGQNLIESSYYGENLKGVLARMGNIEKTVCYVRWGLPVLPKVGTLYDDDYYISTISVEMQPYTTKVILGLSKDFNRLSQYVGINSLKRFYEISERQATESHIAYTDYCIIGDAVEGGGDQLYDLSCITGALKGINNRVSCLLMTGYGEEENILNEVALPVQSAALGNSVLFTASAEDNYSAGQQVVTGQTDGVTGYWANGTAYKDLYGNIEYLSLNYQHELAQEDENRYSLPSASGLTITDENEYIKTKQGKRLLVKIGSTEIPTIDYQIDYVTNRKNLIIGSAFARRNSFAAAQAQTQNARLYVLPYRINKFAKTVDLNGATLIAIIGNANAYTVDTNNGQIKFKKTYTPKSGKSWVVVSGNELLFGENRDIEAGDNDIMSSLVITAKHNIF